VPASFTNIDDQCLDSLRPVIFPVSKDFSCLGKVSVLFVFLPYKPDRTYEKCEWTGRPYSAQFAPILCGSNEDVEHETRTVCGILN